MRRGDVIRAARAALAHPTRLALTLLGIVIGAGSIVLLAGLLRGGEEALVRANQSATDADLIEVRRDDVPIAQRDRTRRELSRADVETLEASRALSSHAAGESVRETQAFVGERRKRISMVSGRPASATLYRLEMGAGRFLSDDDLAEHRRVCVIGNEVATELFGSIDRAREATLHVDDRTFIIVGVLRDKPILGSTDSTRIWNRKVLVPETTYDAIYSPAHEVTRIHVRVGPGEGDGATARRVDALARVVKSVLSRRHLGVANFAIETSSDRDEEKLILNVIELLLLSTGLLALFVGGINVMNVMLVTVTERTREIGIRRAVGARRGDVLGQFLLESAMIALSGGALGVLVGAAGTWLAATILRHVVGAWSFHLEPWSVGLGLGLSLVTGIAFGIYPAWRAARVDPIVALRFE